MIQKIRNDIQKSIPLTSDRIKIRKYKLKDIDRYWEYQSEDELYTYLMCNKITDYKKVESNINKIIAYYDEYKITRYIIADSKTDLMLGVISMYPTDTDGENQVEIGYWIGKGNRNKGIATEALGMVVQQLKKIHNIDRIVVNIMRGNDYSLKAAKKLGFIFNYKYIQDGKTIYKLSIQR